MFTVCHMVLMPKVLGKVCKTWL